MKVEIESKKQQLARQLNGEVIADQPGLSACIKGQIKGFSATVQAVYPGWPFGVMYIVATNPGAADAPPNPQAGRITLYPRVGRGIGSFFSFLFLFEGKSMPVGDRRLEDQFNFVYDNRDIAMQFVHQEGVADQIRNLESRCRFSELVIRTDMGLYLAQPKSFDKIDLAECMETLNLMADLVSVIANNFNTD